MKKEYKFSSFSKGGKAVILLEDGKITINRPGIVSKLYHGFTGSKTILIKDISAVQFKPAGIGRGYLQFVFAGSREAKSGMVRGEKNENIIYFDSGFNNKEINNNAKEIKEYVENYNMNFVTNNINAVPDKYDQLSKIKKLLDDGVLSEKEFEEEKNKILN